MINKIKSVFQAIKVAIGIGLVEKAPYVAKTAEEYEQEQRAAKEAEPRYKLIVRCHDNIRVQWATNSRPLAEQWLAEFTSGNSVATINSDDGATVIPIQSVIIAYIADKEEKWRDA